MNAEPEQFRMSLVVNSVYFPAGHASSNSITFCEYTWRSSFAGSNVGTKAAIWLGTMEAVSAPVEDAPSPSGMSLKGQNDLDLPHSGSGAPLPMWLGYHTGSPSSPRTCKAQSERNFSPWQRPQVSGDEMANARPANGGRLVLMCTLCSSKWRTSNGYPPTASPEKGPEPSAAEFGQRMMVTPIERKTVDCGDHGGSRVLSVNIIAMLWNSQHIYIHMLSIW